MAKNVECFKMLSNLYPKQSIFQEFNSEEDGNTTIYEILECFDEIEYKDIVKTGFAIDYLLFYLANHPDKYPVGQLLTELTSGPKKNKMYTDPIDQLSNKLPKTSGPNRPVVSLPGLTM